LLNDLATYKNANGYTYPGQPVIEDAEPLVKSLLNARQTDEFFKKVVDHEDDLLDLAEDLVDIRAFQKGAQKDIWKKAQDSIRRVKENGDIQNTDLQDVIVNMQTIQKQVKPYKEIPKLSELNTRFNDIYSSILDEEVENAIRGIEDAHQRTLAALSTKEFADELKPDVDRKFAELADRDSLTQITTVEAIMSKTVSANRQYENYVRFFDKKENDLRLQRQEEANRKRKEAAEAAAAAGKEVEPEPVEPLVVEKERKSVTLRSLGIYSGSIETEADVDKFAEQIKEELKKRLKDDTILDVIL
jgi:hypothetical protein